MKKFLLAIGLLLACSSPAFARTCTWDGGGGDNLASTAANWDTDTTCVAGDAVVFDGTSSKNCTFDLAADFASLNTTGYGGVVTASATTKVSGNVTLANGTWAHGNQQFIFDASATITTNNNSLYDVDFTDGGTFAIAGGMTIVNDVILINAVATSTFNGNGTAVIMYVGRHVTATSGRATASSSTNYVSVELNGSTNQTFTGNTTFTNVPGYLRFNSSGGTITMAGGLIPYKGVTHVAGAVDFATNSVATYLKDTVTPTTDYTSNSGSFSFFSFYLADSKTMTLNDEMHIASTFDIGAGAVGTSNINGNTVYLSGDLSNTGGNQVTGTATIEFTGSGTQTWSAANTTYIILSSGSMVVNKSGGSLTVSGSVRFDGNFTYTAGTVITTSSTANFVGSKNHNSSGITWNNWSTFSSGTITLTGNLSAVNVTIPTSTTLSAGSNTITVSGNFTKVGTFTAGTSTLTFSGSTTHTIDGTTTFYNFTCPSGETCSFDDADIFTISGTGAGNGHWTSDDATNTVDIDFTAETISSGNGTRVDSAGGVAVTTSGTITDCVNWSDGSAPAANGNFLMFF